MNLRNDLDAGLARARKHRTNIIGALSDKEFRKLRDFLLGAIEDIDTRKSGFMQVFARKLQAARFAPYPSRHVLQSLSEPEYVQLCNFMAGTFVNAVFPSSEFKPSIWHHITRTVAA